MTFECQERSCEYETQSLLSLTMHYSLHHPDSKIDYGKATEQNYEEWLAKKRLQALQTSAPPEGHRSKGIASTAIESAKGQELSGQ